MTDSAVNALTPVAMLDPSLALYSGGDFTFAKGAKINTYSTQATTTWQSNGGITTFIIVPPSMRHAIGRNMKVRWFVQCIITANAGTSLNAIDIGQFDAPRFSPIAQCTQNLEMKINNNSISLQTKNLVNMLANLNNDEQQLWGHTLSNFPSMTDEYQNYNDPYEKVNLNAVPAISGTLQGNVQDPLGSMGSTTSRVAPPRGAFPIQIMANVPALVPGNPATTTIRFESCEPLWVPMLGVGDPNSNVMMGINQIQLQYNLQSLDRVWSHNNTHPDSSRITNIQVSSYQAPEIMYTYSTLFDSMPIPEQLIYPISENLLYQQDIATPLLPGQTAQVVTTNITLSSNPTRMCFFATRRDQDKTIFTSDVFSGIENVNMTLDNQTGLFATATPQQLWEMSYQNGLECTWQQWKQTKGAIFVCDAGRNLSFQREDEGPSMATNKQLQVQMTIKNISLTETIAFTFWVVIMTNGIISISNGSSFITTNVLTPEKVAAATASNSILAPRSNSMYGGAYGAGKIGKFFKKAAKSIGRVAGQAAIGIAQDALGSGRFAPNAAFGRSMYGAGIGGALMDPRDIRNMASFKRPTFYEEQFAPDKYAHIEEEDE
jgi:hypothetical protein